MSVDHVPIVGGTAPYPVGSLVTFRRRTWVVTGWDASLALLDLAPLTGSDAEVCRAYWPLARDHIHLAQAPAISAVQVGDFVSGALLRDAARIGLRQVAGPLRSMGQIAVRPRPYQLVPLLMALRLDPVRLLIADDVGVGKTVEAGLIAKELLERGTVRRVGVLCPPALCEQWAAELQRKFHIDATIVRSSTVRQLEDALPGRGQSLFAFYPHLVMSIDFVKSDRYREAFLAGCPDLVIVDEAHGAADAGGATSQHQRHGLVARVASNPQQHVLLLTATPHSGQSAAFASLMGLLDPAFEGALGADAPSDRRLREMLGRHVVQRRRADLRDWLGETTPFPERAMQEVPYQVTRAYEDLFQGVLAFTRELVNAPGMSHPQQRVRYWAALALLRIVMSSPQAALDALANRLKAPTDWSVDVMDAARRPQVLDVTEGDAARDELPLDVIGAGTEELGDGGDRQLRALSRQAQALLAAGADPKLEQAVNVVKRLVAEGVHPIIFCRFISTAHYVAARMRAAFDREPRGVTVDVVTGDMADEERFRRIAALMTASRHVLVATDCLSEGIDLQQGFDGVVHYDLPWNPNRLEQREGRVDRYGQRRPTVPTILLYGTNNPIDAAVLHVLIRKARTIYRTLGVTVPVPLDHDGIMETLLQQFFQASMAPQQLRFDWAERNETVTLHREWDRAAEREQVSRSRFAQHGIRPDEVEAVWQTTESLLGSPETVARFMERALQTWSVPVERNGVRLTLNARALNGYVSGLDGIVTVSADPRDPAGALVCDRTHPWVVGWARRVVGTALDPSERRRVARTGALLTPDVPRRTVVMVGRVRYRIQEGRTPDRYAEEVMVTGFQPGHPANWVVNAPEWRTLVDTTHPAANFDSVGERDEAVQWGLAILAQAPVDDLVAQRAQDLAITYQRLRASLRASPVRVQAHAPDWLGAYVLVPGGGY